MIKSAFIEEITIKEQQQNSGTHEKKPDVQSQTLTLIDWKVLYSFILNNDEKFENNTISEITTHLIDRNLPKTFHYRKNLYKFSLHLLQIKDSTKYYYICYMLDLDEPLEILKIPPIIEYADIVNRIEKNTKVSMALAEIIKDKNELLEKLTDPKKIQAEIGNQANQLIDDGKYEEAQNLMKIAKEIPSKFTEAYKEGMDYANNGKYRSAEKSFLTAYDLTGKLNDPILQRYVKSRIEKMQQLPGLKKQVKRSYKKLNSNLTEFPDYLNYIENLPTIIKTINFLDKLENDAEIEKLMNLETILRKAGQLRNEIKQADKEILSIIQKLSI